MPRTPYRATKAQQLAEMASDDEITYMPSGRFLWSGGRLWYGMIATRTSDGRSWDYYLRPDCGSYAGSWASQLR